MARDHEQVLLGVTGSARPSPWARIIEETQRPALILAHNKTLPPSSIPSSSRSSRQRGRILRQLLRLLPAGSLRPAHRHLHREGQLAEPADRPHAPLGHAGDPGARRRDRGRSVSCIYGIARWRPIPAMTFTLKVGEKINEKQLVADLVAQQYKRNDNAFERGTFRAAATPSRSSRPTTRTAPGASPCSATRSRRSPSSTR